MIDGFRSLDGAPMLLPLDSLTLRRSLDAWFARDRIKPRVIGELSNDRRRRSPA